ncbi:hypothetical protein CA54_01780 [Symmachiella macrocystis]|uniref:Uncharacterized protein n=1 Tax=Symmachiella macrocystis TaxID=2527985 RepID=A0A5C6BIK6_9PLAN|nr:hypothetical protein CA54_01780 [Symmachiella macrocystis]
MLHFTGSPDSLQSIYLAHFEERTNLILLTGTDRLRTADFTARTNPNVPS